MRTKIQNDFINILRAELIGETTDLDCEREEVLLLATKHNLSHIIAYAFFKNGEQEYLQQTYFSICLSEQQEFVLNKVRDAFNISKIPFIPLKGSVLRKLYPEEWMRNCCDIDILIQECYLEKAKSVLTNIGFEKTDSKTAHDITFNANGIYVELHYILIEDYRFPKVAKVLERVWEYSKPINKYEYAMSDDMFYFYHIAHMVKHFENGGCGVRSFVDLWMLNHKIQFKKEKRNALLSEGGILKFADAAKDLSEMWFSGSEKTGLDVMEQYIFTGGVYGTIKNGVSVKKYTKGGKIKYIFSRLFVPYTQLKRYYPVLKKHPYLMPIFQAARWIRAFKRKDRYISEFNANLKTSQKNDESLVEMLKEFEFLK